LTSCAVQTEQRLAEKQISSLRESTAQVELLIDCSIDIESGVSKITTSNYSDVSIHFRDYSLLLPGDRVTRMGRHGWNGQILQVKINSVLVQWRNHKEWLDRGEIYPLDHFGKSRIPGKVNNVSEVARRARLSLKTEQASKSSTTKNNQLRLF